MMVTRNQIEQAILDQTDAEVRQRFGVLVRSIEDFDAAIIRFSAGVQEITRAASAAIKALDDLNLSGE